MCAKDEATSALDSSCEKQIQQTIDNLGKCLGSEGGFPKLEVFFGQEP